jgi:hypothetical protein
MQTKAWTGGSAPLPVNQLCPDELRLVVFLFREQLQEYLEYHGVFADLDTMRVFYNRARHDAHATWRKE